ncbi:MAG: phosphoribosylamine--glycine ligase [Muribaculaceae bacterium]|nr:phosphoribosylamine--glycine ligase [Muribaculaceae bacterium]
MKRYNTLLLGSGGREAAIAWKLSQSPAMGKFFIAPGNAGTDIYGTNLAIKPTDFDAVYAAIAEHDIDLVVAGNEDPLVRGLREALTAKAQADGRTLLIVGPGADGAALEGSKDFAKDFMGRHNIPTARHLTVTSDTLAEGDAFLASLKAPYVLKADGLAAGKGVLIIDKLDEARSALRRMLDGQFGSASAKVVIEEFLSGIECSVFVLTDGNGGYVVLPPAKDYKRVGEGDTGLNTGGMGSVCPPPIADEAFMAKVDSRIIRPTIDGLRAEGIDYRGFIFLGLIRCGDEPFVIEYNVRMGDPETESVMPRITTDLLPVLAEAAAGKLTHSTIETDPRTTVAVMAVSGGYPEEYRKGMVITGIPDPEQAIVFHAGTSRDSEGRIVTAGGRVLAAVSYGDSISEAAERSYAILDGIDFEGMYLRRDIGKDLL